MCVYRIKEFPYIAVSNAYKVSKNKCFVEDTKGNMKKVDPLYIGPFDGDKILEFGSVLSNYFKELNDLQTNVETKSLEIFNVARA